MEPERIEQIIKTRFDFPSTVHFFHYPIGTIVFVGLVDRDGEKYAGFSLPVLSFEFDCLDKDDWEQEFNLSRWTGYYVYYHRGNSIGKKLNCHVTLEEPKNADYCPRYWGSIILRGQKYYIGA